MRLERERETKACEVATGVRYKARVVVERRAVLLEIVVFVERSRGRRVHERYLYTCRTAGWSLGAVDAIQQRNSSLFSFWANFGHTSCKNDEEPNKRPGSSSLFNFLLIQ